MEEENIMLDHRRVMLAIVRRIMLIFAIVLLLILLLHPEASARHQRIVVVLSEQRLECHEGSARVWQCPCSTGKPTHPTLPGTYVVQRISERRAFRRIPDVIEVGPILSLSTLNGDTVDFSIHNWPWELTTERWCEDPALAGEKRLSEGCVMLRDPDMRKLVSWVRAGTIVEIREK